MIDILNVSANALEKALNSEFRDFEDAIQHFCALENNVDCIITRNVKDYVTSLIPVYYPSDFLREFFE